MVLMPSAPGKTIDQGLGADGLLAAPLLFTGNAVAVAIHPGARAVAQEVLGLCA